MSSHFVPFCGLYSGCRSLRVLTPRVRLKEYSSSMSRSQFSRVVPSFVFLFVLGSFSAAFASPRPADGQASTDKAQANQAQSTNAATDKSSGDPLKRELTEKQKRQNAKSLRHELEDSYKKWLNQDVRWIITDDERKAFMQLSNNEERDQFIEAFWQRRNPNPDSEDNEFKDEHYRRIEYANEHFPAGKPGWMTDRGRIYIVYGPADEVESHPSGGSYERPMEEGGGETSTYPFEQWRYRYIEGIGQEVIIEFVDTCMCGDYHMTMDRSEKDALKMVPNAGLTLYEQMGMSSKADRFSGGGLEQLGRGNTPLSESQNEFTRLEQFAKLQKAPVIKFKDLEAVVNSTIKYNTLPMKVRADYIKVTDA